jgi:hypothetical protein
MNIESATSKNTESKWDSVSDHPTEAKGCARSKQESVADHLAETDIGVAKHQEGEMGYSEDDGNISEGDGAENFRPSANGGPVSSIDSEEGKQALLSVADTEEEKVADTEERKKRGRKERRVWKASDDDRRRKEEEMGLSKPLSFRDPRRDLY